MKIPAWIRAKERRFHAGGHDKGSFLKDAAKRLSIAMMGLYLTGPAGEKKGPLKALTAKGRVTGMLVLAMAGAFARDVSTLLLLMLVAVAVSLASGTRVLDLAKRVAPVFILTSLVALPAALALVTPGRELAGPWPISITEQGLFSAIRLVLRAAVMTSFVMLLVLSMSHADLFKGLRGMKVPDIFVTTLFLTLRNAFLLIRTAVDAVEARASRTIRQAKARDLRRWLSERAVFFLERSLKMSDDLHMAMRARGFDRRLKTPSADRLNARDFMWLVFTTFVFFMALRP